MSQDELLTAIESRYGFQLPAMYRHMVRQEWIDTPDVAKYTPLFMGEWLQLQAILDFDFQSVDPATPANPGLIPFAAKSRRRSVLLVPGTDGERPGGDRLLRAIGMYDRVRLDAPSLLGFCYREVLDQLTAGSDLNEERFAKEHFAKWRTTWYPLFPSAWQQTLAAIPDSATVEWTRTLKSGHQEQGRAFSHPDERDRIVARDLAFDGIDQEVRI